MQPRLELKIMVKNFSGQGAMLQSFLRPLFISDYDMLESLFVVPQPRLMFVSKAGTILSGAPFRYSTQGSIGYWPYPQTLD
jgi:hypothetical protein